MAFDNVTLFEINVGDLPIDEPIGTSETREQARVAEEYESDEDSGGSTLKRLLGLFVAGAVLAGIAVGARKLISKRRSDDDEEIETEPVEPGVERIQS